MKERRKKAKKRTPSKDRTTIIERPQQKLTELGKQITQRKPPLNRCSETLWVPNKHQTERTRSVINYHSHQRKLVLVIIISNNGFVEESDCDSSLRHRGARCWLSIRLVTDSRDLTRHAPKQNHPGEDTTKSLAPTNNIFERLSKSIVQTQRNFRLRFNLRKYPSRNVINVWVSRWRQSGSVVDLERPGQQSSVCTPENRIRQAFIRNVEGTTVTVTATRYTDMLETFLQAELAKFHHPMYYQQAGATSHTAMISMETLRRMFPSRLIRGALRLPVPLLLEQLTRGGEIYVVVVVVGRQPLESTAVDLRSQVAKGTVWDEEFGRL
ncbi:hypothetical protein ANN_17276 [Periplaneta americana]|uniref:DUF4817 domain-containing protein n=1 Tax=Periplaneta americana TaxID=6978 RepID=A0ABQ8SSI0_PERAM|nr:hypothetical protein ANN_17276 [Periplaneta americana]